MIAGLVSIVVAHGHLHAHVDPEARAAAGVIARNFPSIAGSFRFRKLIDSGHPLAYRYEAKGGVVTVAGTSGVAMCRGAYDYLRQAGGAQVTWTGTTLSRKASRLPDSAKVVVDSPYKWVLQDNVCTFGYTTAFFGWEQWQRYLDVMALHGVNMEFSPVGGEAIWNRVWRSFGISQKNIDNLFTGPAFLPWHRMGNVYKHDGPLPESYKKASVKLEHKILDRMRSLGIEPVAPGFAGFVPPGFSKAYPDQQVLNMQPWCGFGGAYSAWILHPLSKMYSTIGGRYIKAWEKEFGHARYFLADSFNELQVPVPSDRSQRLEDLALFGKAVYDGIKAGNPNGTWVMQGWLFYNAKNFWDKESTAALLSRVPDSKMLILDLFAEAAPIWTMQDAFYGKPWVLSTITTWGGNNQAYGNFKAYSKLSSSTLKAPNHGKLVGFGISYEGSESNEVEYEMLCDSAWSPKPIPIPSFLAKTAVQARYGRSSSVATQGWKGFAKSAYDMPFGVHPSHLLQERPSTLNANSVGAESTSPDFGKGVDALLAARGKFGNDPLYKADVVQLTAQWALVQADRMLRDASMAAQLGDRKLSIERTARFVHLADQADRLLASHPLDRLDRWVTLARAWGRTPAVKNYYESDAKRQVTVWGGADFLSEYAAKMWSGLIRNYYVPRWALWLDAQRNGRKWDMKKWEEKWITTPGGHYVQPYPDPIAAALRINAELKRLPVSHWEDIYGGVVGEWKSGETSPTPAVKEWDVTSAVNGDGTLFVKFQYTSGSHRLDIQGAELLIDGNVVATDAHDGQTGLADADNVYKFKVAGFQPGDHVVLRAKVRSDGGSDSNGQIHAKLWKLRPVLDSGRPPRARG